MRRNFHKLSSIKKFRASKIGIEQDISSSYIDDAEKIIGSIEDRPDIVVDIGGGAAKGFASDLLTRIGCNVEIINEDLIGSSRGPDPTADKAI